MEYQVHGHQQTIRHNPVSLDNLRRMEISAKEVKCRKNCRCNQCGRTIFKGEIALKTVQPCPPMRTLFNAYCDECYHIAD